MIFTDRTSRSIVVGCRRCGTRDVVLDDTAAGAWARDHLDRVHPDPAPERARALTAARARKRRHDTP